MSTKGEGVYSTEVSGKIWGIEPVFEELGKNVTAKGQCELGNTSRESEGIPGKQALPFARRVT